MGILQTKNFSLNSIDGNEYLWRMLYSFIHSFIFKALSMAKSLCSLSGENEPF